MKNKILASVLAVCLFVGMAVPAFAATTADFSSSANGDSAKATKVEFFDGEKVITEKEIQQNGTLNIAELVRLFESKDQLILNNEDLDYALDGGSLIFSLNDTTVKAIDSKGTANVVVTNVLTNKVLGKLKLIAAPAAPAPRLATGYKFKNAENKLVVTEGIVGGVAAPTDQKIVVVPTPAGTIFDTDQKWAIEAAVAPVLNDILSYNAISTGINVNNLNTLCVKGMPQASTMTINFTNTKLGGTTDGLTSVRKNSASTATNLIIDVVVDADADTTIKVQDIASEIRKTFKTVTLENVVTAGGAVQSTIPVKVGLTTEAFTVAAGNETAPGITGSYNANDKQYEFAIPNANDSTKMLVQPSKLNITVKNVPFVDPNGKNVTNTASTSITTVKPVEAKAIAITPVIELEVGAIVDIGGHIKYGPTDCNVGKGYTVVTDYANENVTDYNDFAPVTYIDGTNKIIGVKKGVNKVTVTMSATGYTDKTATMLVNVVSRGTKVVPTVKTKAPKVEAGKTTVFAITGAKGDITYKSADEKIAKIDSKGTITGVKAGTTTITATVDGVTLTETVTVSAVKPETKPDGKPSTNPSTGVALLGQLF